MSLLGVLVLLAPDDYELRYNPYERKWDYAPPDSDLKYNPYERDWEFEE
jgi:hypothetical protein